MAANQSGRAFRVEVLGALALALLLSAASPTSSPVADAARKGDREAVRALIERGDDVNGALGDGMTALHWAALQGDAEMTQLLLSAGANVGAVTRLGAYTPLHMAAQAGEASVVEALLRGGSDPKAGTSTGGTTALHFAAQAGNPRSVSLLIEHGAEIDAREGEWHQTPLMFAAVAGRVEAVQALLSAGANPALTARVIDMVAREEEDRVAASERARRIRGTTAAAAAGGGRGAGPIGAVGAGGERTAGGAQAAPQQLSPSEQINPDLIDPLSYAGLVHAYGGHTALLLAAREGHREVVAALIDGGADINQPSAGDRPTPILMAAINGHFDLVGELMDLGADIHAANVAGVTPLYAVLNQQWIPKSRHPQPTHSLQQETGYLQLMERLLREGADPNVRLRLSPWFDTFGDDYLGVDRMGATPFWRAAYATDVEAMRLLVSFGADPNIPTLRPPARRRPFAQATREGETDPSGLPPVPVGGPGVWPIHAAAGVGYGEGFAANVHRHVPGGWMPAVRYLVEEHGADVNARDHNGYTPLHHAAARGDNEMILYLVEKGADVTAVSRRDQTTVDMANGPVERISPFLETIALLESLGAKNNHRCVSC